jgi:hypothetical protein
MAWDGDTGSNTIRKWWDEKLEPRDKAIAMAQTVRYLRNQQQYRQQLDLFHAQLYGDCPISGFGLGQFVRSAQRNRVPFNVVQQNVDALHAKETKVRPKCSFITSGGDYAIREQGRQLEKWGDGLFYQSKFWDSWSLAILHACIWGDGFIKTTVDKKRKTIKFSIVYPFEVTVNESEALYGSPRSFYQQRFYDRAVLINRFPDKRDMIEEAPLVGYDGDSIVEEEWFQFGRNELVDQVMVYEGWHLPSAPGADDGLHIIGLPNGDLAVEKWEFGWFPFTKISRMVPPVGYFGTGVPEQIAGIQLELNYLNKNISQAHHLLSKARVFIETSSKVPKTFFTNEIGTFVPYSGTPPMVVAPQAVSSDVYQYQKYLVEMSGQMCGNPQMLGGGEKPHGVDSAKALRTIIAVQDQRFIEFARSCENAACTAMEQAVAFARSFGSLKVKYSTSGTLEVIDFKDVDLDEESYVIKAFPTSMLSTIPAARMSEVDDMIRAGFIEPEYGMELLGFPDIEAYSKRKNAGRKVIERNLYEITAKGNWVAPENYDNHALAMKMATETYQEARLDGVPQERLDMIIDYMEITHELLSEQEAQAAAMSGQANLNEQPVDPAAMGPEGGMPVPPV